VVSVAGAKGVATVVISEALAVAKGLKKQIKSEALKKTKQIR
jgi:hypothetical protein